MLRKSPASDDCAEIFKNADSFSWPKRSQSVRPENLKCAIPKDWETKKF